MCFQLTNRGVNAVSCVMCAVGSLDGNVAKVKEMLQEMRRMTMDKEGTQSKSLHMLCIRESLNPLFKRMVLTYALVLTHKMARIPKCYRHKP